MSSPPHVSPIRRRGLLAAAVASWGAAAFPQSPEGAAGAREKIAFDRGGGRVTIEGVVLVEAQDGGLLVERDDDRLELLEPDTIRSREPAAALAAAETPRETGRRILADLPAGFDLLVTRRYCICFDTSRPYAQWCGGLFERLHDGFTSYWRQAGFEPTPARRPLGVVIFAGRDRYEAFAARDLGAAADRVVGYYNLLTNRVTTFDLTGSAAIARPAGRASSRTGLEILSSPEAGGLVATLVHEATHQVAFNVGLHRRLAPVPLWLSEGIAMFCETPDLASDRGWRGIGGVNQPRLSAFLAGQRPGELERIVRGDDDFRSTERALDAYARAWALTFFLVQTRKRAFVDYLRVIAGKEPLAEDTPEVRLREFEAAFGGSPRDVEEPLLRHLARQRPAAGR